MARPNGHLGTLLLSATGGTVASVLALALLARAEGHAAVQPLNATSHWLHGRRAAGVTRADLAHTGVGLATHAAATLFWAALWVAWPGRRRPGALAISALAAAVDYTITPRRFTPGWEFVLSRSAMAGAYGAMALGLATGARLARR